MTTLAADDSYLWDFAKERKVPTISPSGSLSLNNHYYSGLSVYCFGERHGLTACGKTLIRAVSGKGTTSVVPLTRWHRVRALAPELCFLRPPRVFPQPLQPCRLGLTGIVRTERWDLNQQNRMEAPARAVPRGNGRGWNQSDVLLPEPAPFLPPAARWDPS